ncbi:MAG TPA: DUF4917 family protein [Pyrinomonadaceae bacterium]|nr:DUF4917 family protein [Pyrinomonadaceae bacterium]HMP65994.1 DUF4917 family protein [Pyrinomonadaceae bacterium]
MQPISEYNSVDELPSYEEIVEYLRKKNRPRHLLVGNGFSMAYDRDIFSYNALAQFVDNLEDQLLKDLFTAVNTKNFEQVMQQLESFSEIARVFGADSQLIQRIADASDSLKRSLLNAVKELHPEHVFKISREKSAKCAQFLSGFLGSGGTIFTTNYDLLLYWVLMRNGLDNKDGFGREPLNPGVWEDEPEYSELRWGLNSDHQNVFYLHGALHIFDTGTEIEKEEYDNAHYLLEKVKERIDDEDYPIFVTAGTAQQKMVHIRHNRYLSFCYDALEQIRGSLIVFGFGFGQYDTHIIDAINKAALHGAKGTEKLHSIYVSIRTNESLEYLKSIEDRFQLKVNGFQSDTACVWE